MRKMIRRVRDVLLVLSNTEWSIYEGASDSARRMRVALGLAMVVVPLLSGFFMGHLFYVALDNVVIAGVLGTFWAGAIGIFDFILVSGGSGSWMSKGIRIVMALVIGYVVAVPVELKLFEDRIQNHVEQEMREEHEKEMERVKQESGFDKLNTRIDTLLRQQDEAQAEIQRARRIQECELTGTHIAGLPCSGESGKGPVYRNAVRSENEAQEQAREIETTLNRLRARRDELRDDIERDYEQPDTIRDPLMQYEALEAITAESDAARLFAWALHLFFMATELLVVLAKMTRQEDDYDAGKKIFIAAKKEIDEERTDGFRKEMIKEIQKNPRSREGETLVGFLREWGRRRDEDNEQEPAQSERPGRAQREDRPAGSAQDEREEGDSEHETPDRGKTSHWGGWKTYLNVGLIIVGVLEGFTSVAPVQRLFGHSLNALPASARTLVMGENDAQRYENVGFIEEREQRGILGADGTTLARSTTNPDFPETLRKTLVHVENARFWDRYAADWWSTLGAMRDNVLAGRMVRGGSSIPQQFTGDVILKNTKAMRAGLMHGLALKFWELVVASGLRARHSREEMLRLYMQGIYLGQDRNGAIRGFAEASWAYFGKSVEKLEEVEQIALVSILTAPNKFARNSKAFADRYATVIGRLRNGLITDQEAERLLEERPVLRVREDEDYREVRAATRHARSYLRAHASDSVGTMRSTISAGASVDALRTLRGTVRELEARTGLTGDLEGFALVAYRGRLLVMIGSVSPSGFNRTDSLTAYRPGSLGKPPVFTEYLAQGGSPSDPLTVQSQTFTLANGQSWQVDNYSSAYDHHGPMPMAQALARSINASAASVAVSPVMKRLQERMATIGYEGFYPVPSSALGSRSVRPLRLFRLMQAYVPPFGAIPSRFSLEQAETVQQQEVWSEDPARKIALALNLAVSEGTLSGGRRCCGWTARTHRGKSGTAQKHAAAGVLVTRPGGLSLLMGVSSRSGKSMTYRNERGGVAGGTLVPHVDEILKSDALAQRTNASFNFSGDPKSLLLSQP